MEDRWLKLEEIVRRVVREEIEALKKTGKPAIKLVNGRWEGITKDVLEAMKEAYPAVDISAQMKEAASWCLLNPNDAPRKDYGRFLGTWMKRHQDRHAIRSIPTGKETPGIAKKLCAYCDKVATGSVGSRWTCSEHVRNAMSNDPIPHMRGVEPKAVAGE